MVVPLCILQIRETFCVGEFHDCCYPCRIEVKVCHYHRILGMDLKPTPYIPVKRPQQELRIVKKFVRKAFDNSWITSRASIANSRSTGSKSKMTSAWTLQHSRRNSRLFLRLRA